MKKSQGSRTSAASFPHVFPKWFPTFFAILFVMFALHSFAFTRSEDELMRADVAEAKARSKDFKAQQARSARADEEREVAATEIKAERAEFEQQLETARVRFIEVRNANPDPEIEAVRLEQAFDSKKLAEDEEMDRNRLGYLRKRAEVQRTIDNEAYIDPNEEYGVR